MATLEVWLLNPERLEWGTQRRGDTELRAEAFLLHWLIYLAALV